jgi:chemotaxis receptor (MCP) glutamine deamidase CheD
MMELIARMAEIVASRNESDVLVAMSLGSCIGVALLDRVSGQVHARGARMSDAPGTSPPGF